MACGLALLAATGAALAAAPTQSDPEAVEIAESVMERMGGKEAWDATRYVRWRFFDRRLHYWDKWTGDIRIESEDAVTLMNINTKEGRVWQGGEEITDATALQEALDRGYRAWINDSYWLFMPYKLLDPGVTLRYMGEDMMADDREADVLELTFDNVGVTPQNRYLVYVARDSGLVEQWSYFQNREDSEPGFTLPWTGWQQFGEIMLSTDRGRGFDWNIAVYDNVPALLFLEPSFRMQ